MRFRKHWTRAPLGISLKLIEAMSQGIPSVVTTVGATGLGLADGSEAMIAGDDREFIDKVVDLYEDEGLWTAVQRAGEGHMQLLPRCDASALGRVPGHCAHPCVDQEAQSRDQTE